MPSNEKERKHDQRAPEDVTDWNCGKPAMKTDDLNHPSAVQCEENENEIEKEKRGNCQRAKLCSSATRIHFAMG